MSENNSRQDLSRYDALTTEELEQILRADALITDEDEAYLEMIVYVAEVYAQRKKNEKNEAAPDPQPETKRLSFRRILRPLVAAVAVVSLVFCGTITAKSMGFDLWGTVAKWTSSVFTFEPPETTLSDVDPLETIERMKPKWMPEGFELLEMKESNVTPVSYYALYQKEDTTITFRYREGNPNNTIFSEKNDGVVETFHSGQITFYIFTNTNRIMTIWYYEGVVCQISGTIPADDMKSMINSIG